MSHVVSSSAPITSAHTVKQYAGLGILGSDIPTTGDNGGSPVLNDSINPTGEYHWRVETAPSAGVLTIYPDLTFEWDATGVPNGSYPWAYRLFEDGTSQGTATVSQTVGSAISAVYSDVTANYSIRSLVAKNLAAVYAVLASVAASSSANYNIEITGTVSSSAYCDYAIRGVVQSSGDSSYLIRSVLSASIAAAYNVRNAVAAPVVASYIVEGATASVYADVSASYYIDRVVGTCPTAVAIAAEVVAALQAHPNTLTLQRYIGLS